MGILFNNTNDSLTQATGYAIPATGTLSIWYNHVGAQTDGALHRLVFICDADYVPQFGLSHTGANELEAGWYTDADYRVTVASGSYTLTADVWSHILLTWDDTANESRLYLNGTLIGTPTATLVTADLSTFALLVGNESITPVNAHGALAELAIWSRVLDAGERTAMFGGDAASLHPTNLSRYWRLEDVSQLVDEVAAAALTNANCTDAGTHPTITYPTEDVTGTVAMTIGAPAMAAEGTFVAPGNVTGTVAMTIGAPAMAAEGTFVSGADPVAATVGRVQGSSVSGGGQAQHGRYVCDATPAATTVDIGYTPSAVLGWDVTDGDAMWLWSEGMASDTCMLIASGSVAKVSSAGITSVLNGFIIGTDAAVQVASHEFRFVAVR